MAQGIKNGIEHIGDWWCRLMHHSLAWPIHRQYVCKACGRRYAVQW